MTPRPARRHGFVTNHLVGPLREWLASGHARLSRHGGAAVPQRGGVTAGRAGGDARTGTGHLWSTTTAPTAPQRWRVATAPTSSPRPGRATARRCTPGSWRRRRRSWRSIDADGSLDPRDLPELVDDLERGADMAIGRRRAVKGLKLAVACPCRDRRRVLAAASQAWPARARHRPDAGGAPRRVA